MSKYIQIISGEKAGEGHKVIDQITDRGINFMILDDNSRMNTSLLNEVFVYIDSLESGMISKDDAFFDPHANGTMEELFDENHQGHSSYSEDTGEVIEIGSAKRDFIPDAPAEMQKSNDSRISGLEYYDSTKVSPRKAETEKKHPIINILDKAKKSEKLEINKISISLDVLMPKTSLYESLSDLYDDEALDIISQYIYDQYTKPDDIKKSIIESIKKKYNE